VIRNTLWDVDGTLFDTYPAITYAFSKSLNEMGLSVAMNVIDGLARESISYCVETLSQRFKLDPDLLRRRFAETYQTLDPANQTPFPGVREVCEFIYRRDGLNIVITHRAIQSTQTLLETHAFSEYFEDIFSIEQGYSRKPDPAMIVAALDKHALDPDQTLLVGDHDLDIQAGEAVGIRTCLFGQVEATATSDFQIENFAQLLNILTNETLSN
jgi:phosphoglycolate phosphatase-like HAD superfamily hydrolase